MFHTYCSYRATTSAVPCSQTVIALMYWQAQGYIERLEQEIMELQRRDAELRQILETEDNIHFLQVKNSQSHLTSFLFIHSGYLSVQILCSGDFIICAEFPHTLSCTGAHGTQSADKPRVFLQWDHQDCLWHERTPGRHLQKRAGKHLQTR